MTISNPLLLQNPIEKVDQIVPDNVVPAIKTIINENLQAIEQLVEQPDLDWPSLMLPLEKLENRLSKAWSPVSHLNSVCNSDELRAAYDEALADLTAYGTALGQHKGLFTATDKLYQSKEQLGLSDTQKHILKHELIGFKLSGLHLNEADQKTFASIQSRLAELSSKFEQNLMDATMSWTKQVSESDLAGLPETEMAMLKANAASRDMDGCLITLEIPSYLAIVTYADDRALREEVYSAYTTRASELGPDKGKFDNSEIMAELLTLKNQKAKLLGFKNYAELSVETKMAETPEQVLKFLQQLNQASQAQAKAEFAELKAFASENGVDDIQAWDVAYFSEKLKQKNYQISQSELRPYFPVDKVISGLFDITEHHFEVTFKKKAGVNVWHKDVKTFQILRNDQVIAEFYLDLYARGHKRGGAWMDDYQGRMRLSDDQMQIPVAYLTCNFAPPVDDAPALLTHDEVVTLFHEFGHGIHHMLTQVDELSASGISNVPWDAVELPSQFMENFCYEPEVISKLSEHYQTGDPLPQDKLDKLIAAKNFQSALMMVRQLEFALFDMKIHLNEPLSAAGIQQILDQTRDEVAVIKPPKFNRFQHGFSHIFAGGYSAGYYSYKWAEVLSADAYSLFEEEGVMNPDAGRKFRENILEKGGSAEPMDLFVAFRGRKPEVEPLLRHSGIKH
ncbi:M3 family metallopeptidase [Aliikangiella marina]|uniref:oligopeptidase A n=1 Tax=Aliikangiella marina TaxID=1712262 RepID=A0A545T4Z6_9GAMM|nr:M3 family metallopeptidase [Aliikangiella marina]TQV72284.1 M3 family metallopeptidase [Aliikangiella marina]